MKIDRSFVESANGGLGSAPIVRMLIQLARSYDIDVVAEGVETARQAEELVALECGFAQGFHYYRPMSPDAVGALLGLHASSSRQLNAAGLALAYRFFRSRRNRRSNSANFSSSAGDSRSVQRARRQGRLCGCCVRQRRPPR